MIPIGAHVPMAGGLLAALEYGIDTGCEAMQIFPKSPRRWIGPTQDPAACEAFLAARTAAGFGPVFTHSSYLINLGAQDEALWGRSTIALADELVRGGQVGASGVVVHLGRRFSDDEEESVERVRRCVIAASEIAGDGAARLLLENSAGAGRQFGVSIAEMGAALNAVRHAGVDAALCFDTCHGFAAGIDVRTPEGWQDALGQLAALCGPRAIALVHANDCKGELGSHKDRHDWIGDGFLGEMSFAALFQQPELRDAAVVVEMPGEVPYKDEENVRRLKALRDVSGAHGAPGPARA
jgi:deoxyribonuclease-4